MSDMSMKSISFADANISISQSGPLPSWVRIRINDYEFSLYPEDFHLLADFLISLKPQIKLDRSE